MDAISVAGNVATITVFGHGFSGNDRVMLSGADQVEVNGIYTIAILNPSTFNITLPAAVTPTGNLICRHVIDDGASGWSWYSGADGLGYSLELVNPAMPNSFGQNWRASTTVNGTPASANSVRSLDIAPLILDVRHFPAVPNSTDPVIVTARIRDDHTNGPISVQLFYRNHTTSPNGFVSATMLDDGLSGDGVAGDGLFGVSLLPQGNGTVMEFYVQAGDPGGLIRTWPAAAWDTNNVFGQLANAYFQVDDEAITNTMPAFRVIMSGTERNAYAAINQNSDAEQNITAVITDGDSTEVRYGGGLRIRGAGSRSRNPKNNRVNLPNDRLWNDMSAVNLNGQFVHAQLMGAAVSRKVGLPASDAYVVQYRMNGVNPAPQTTPNPGSGAGAGYGTFILVQPVNGDLGADLFPDDGDGNVYRASTGNHNADLTYQGTNPTAYLTRGYTKTSNQTENDWTDLMRLTESFSNLNEADFMSAVRTNINVEFWMRYFAVGTLINFGETSLFNGRGDDYAMYRGINDPRFVLIGHDFDTIFGQGDTTAGYALSTNSSPFIMMSPPFTGGNQPNVPMLRRLMTNDAYVPFFFAEILRLSSGVFHPSQLNPLFDQMLSGWGPSSTTIDTMKTYAANRRANVLAQIPLTLTIGHSLTTVSNGLPYTTSPTVTLFGDSHAVDTSKVLVDGIMAGRVAWQARWTNIVSLRPGINRVIVQSLNFSDVEFARSSVDIWYDDGSVTSVSGNIATDTVWSAANGPYQVTGNLTVAPGVTLTIQPGTTVWFGSGVDLVVANGGRLLAEGTDTARIRLSAAPGVANWGGITINGAAASPESRFAYTHIDGNGDTAIEVADGTAFLSHLTFGNPARQYLSLDRASFVVEDCVFPAITGSFESTHGAGGIKAGGRGIFQRNYFGRVRGYNDALDFTGGNRPGPILQVLNNVFMGSDDDLLDFDSTDAWIEGNIFLHTHRNGSPDSASAVSGGADNADTSQITMVRNLFYDVDQAANAKQGNFYTMVNNTIVRQTKVGSQDTNAGVIILMDVNEQGVPTTEGAGIYLEGNIIVDAENLTRNVTSALVTFTNNIIHQLAGTPWAGAGGANLYADPLLKRIPPFSETTNFNSWAAAQVMWDHFSLLPGSPAAGRGPNRRDGGGVVAPGASVAGEPVGTTPNTTALLTVGYNQMSNGVPVSGFPSGSGHTHYRWRLDGGAWSSETPTATPIALSNLGPGPHFVEVSGRNDAGFYQDDPVFGTDARASVSRTWTVDPTASPLRITEVLAANAGILQNGNTTPDAIELYNAGDTPFSLGGVRLTDDPSNPDKFIFPAGAVLPSRTYLVVYADSANPAPGYHLGFSLNQDGDAVYAYASVEEGGVLLDSLQFGLQITDLSIGRMADGSWALAVPTFGSANRSAVVGDPAALRINEWLAGGTVPFDQDFVEVYNTGSLPVELGGLYLTDELVGNPTRHRVRALSFIPGFGYQRFIADGDADAGADHLGFSLGFEQGEIGLFRSDLKVIDCVFYQPQQLNVSQGRSPNGSSAIVFLSTPTPGAPNPLVTVDPSGGALVINEVLANNGSLLEAGRTPDWLELYNGTTNTVALGDMSLTDDTLRPRRFVIPAGTSLPPAGRLRVICDPGNPNSGGLIHTNFALRSSGGGVYLFDALSRGGSLLNSVVYGLQTPDLSIGRVPDGTPNWTLNLPSPDTANLAATLGPAGALRVNEWLADPVPGDDDWFEIYNSGSLPVALGGLYLTDDLNNRTKQVIAPLSYLGNGTNAYQQFIADGNTGSGADHVSFSLRGAGEAVGVSTTTGTLIDGYAFGAQTQDVSEGRFPDGSTNVVVFPGTASPGDPNWRWLAEIVINEVLTHTDEPLEDAIELRNLTGTAIDVGGWWLSDDNRTLQKYQIPAPRIIPPNGFTVVYETAFTNDATATVPFALSSGGDEVVLSGFSAGRMTGYRTRVTFGAQFNGVSFGRYITSDNREELVAMESRTFGEDDPGNVEEFRGGMGLTNSGPRIGPVVISEIMYHPPDQGTNDNVVDEFIELRNITTAPVPLFDPAHPENGWRLRDAVDFDFTSGTSIDANSYLLVVGFDPVGNPAALASFRSRFNVSSSTPIVGPWSGRLANDSEEIELRRPDEPNLADGEVPYVLVERVRYFDTLPWPADADGTGRSLQRVSDNQFGNDPINWTAASPTPGPQASNQDTDDDGLPDSWEILHGFDPLNPIDAGLDADGDGLTNAEEFGMGTDPRNAASGVSITSITSVVPGVSVKLVFTAAANKAYAIQFVNTLGSSWQTVQTVAEASTTRLMELVLPATGGRGFYRLSLVPMSALRIDSIETGGGQVQLTLSVPANAASVLQFKSALGSGSWSTVATYPAASTNRIVNYIAPIPAGSASGFYRMQSQ
ncbi:MAG TPA: lamin tail domain-containing protein [Verrucomicrobiae bacterium]|nr:lamin tail domain-containing protein [Verrucomicrobiae bacterium]